jgi:hypothetical protein
LGVIPVNLRTDNDPADGNVVSALLCNLGTHLKDPAERLEAIHASMRDDK